MLRITELATIVTLLSLLGSMQTAHAEAPPTYLIKVKIKQGDQKQPNLLVEPTLVVVHDRPASFMSGVEDADDARLLAGTRIKVRVTQLEAGKVRARCNFELADTDFAGEKDEPIEVSRRLHAKFTRKITLDEMVHIPLTKVGDVWAELTIRPKDAIPVAESAAVESSTDRK